MAAHTATIPNSRCSRARLLAWRARCAALPSNERVGESGIKLAWSVGKYVFLTPTTQIKGCAGGDKLEASLGQMMAALALQHLVEAGFQLMQIQHVLRRIFFLCCRQHMGAPVGTLLLLVGINAEEFAQQVFQAMTISISAGDFRGDLGAIKWCRVSTRGLRAAP
jgi:hypothetical protein